MFEIDAHWPRLRVRIGPWHFRTWRSYFMRLPSGYRSPLAVYSVESESVAEDEAYQWAAFLDEDVAQQFIATYQAELPPLHINTIVVHSRLQDWQWDR